MLNRRSFFARLFTVFGAVACWRQQPKPSLVFHRDAFTMTWPMPPRLDAAIFARQREWNRLNSQLLEVVGESGIGLVSINGQPVPHG